MPTRLCEVCRKAENPLGRLKFSKWLDGKVYCENCIPSASSEILPPTAPVSSSGLEGTSAGSMVVIPCPACLGQGRASRIPTNSHLSSCKECAGYGQVRIPVNFLNVYTPGKAKTSVLTE